MIPSPAAATPRLSPAEWDGLRRAFLGSPMLEVSLAGLAENIDGCDWPVAENDERPAAYVELSHGEALARLRAHGLPPARLDTLADILRGTLAFDESFGAMTRNPLGAAVAANALRRNLERLGIPPEFPVAFCALSPGTLGFCEREGMHTLGDFLAFSRGASRSVIVGGEFRDLLNAVVHVDEQTLALHLPFRPRATGLFLVEALGHLVRPLDIEARIALARRPQDAPADLRARATRLVDHFADQAADLRARVAQGAPVGRLVVSLEDLSLESAVAGLLEPYLAPPRAEVAASSQTRRGWRPRWWPR